MCSEQWAFSILRSTHLNAHPYCTQNSNLCVLSNYFFLIRLMCFRLSFLFFVFRLFSHFTTINILPTEIDDDDFRRWMTYNAGTKGNNLTDMNYSLMVLEVFQYFSFSFYEIFSQTLCWSTSLRYGYGLNRHTNLYWKK